MRPQGSGHQDRSLQKCRHYCGSFSSNESRKRGRPTLQRQYLNAHELSHWLMRSVVELRGPGVPDLRMVKIEFYVVCDRGRLQLPDAFCRIKIYCFQTKLSNFEISKIQVITVRARTLIAISQNFHFWNFKTYLLLHFLSNHLET